MKKKFIEVIKQFALIEKKPILGICLGMQLLLSKSFEFGEHVGLDLIPGEVVKLSFKDKNKKIPHIGWKKILFKEKNFFSKRDLIVMNFILFIHLRSKPKIQIIQLQHVNIMKKNCIRN